MLDRPTERSSHAAPVVRGAGLVIGPAVAVGAVIGACIGDVGSSVLAGVALMVIGSSLVGAADDLRPGLPWNRRLVACGLIAAVGSLLLLEEPTALVVTVAAVVVVSSVNATNFMDGINGISGFVAIASGSAFVVMGWRADLATLSVIGAACVGAGAAFLPWNVPRARAFLGDSGSYALGAAYGVAVVIAVDGGVPASAALTPLLPYAADTSYTLLRRARRRARLSQPHREHAYQRVADRLGSHVAAAGLVGALTAVVSTLGLVSMGRSTALQFVLIGVASALAVAYAAVPAALDWGRR